MAATPYIGEVTMFGGTFAPAGWAFCDGQLLPISSNVALFSILGTTYGGDGVTTFGLPDLRGREPIHEGPGPGLTPKSLGEKGGVEMVTLAVNNLPAHDHPAAGTVPVSSGAADASGPVGKYPADNGEDRYSSTTDADNTIGATIDNNGGNQAFNVRSPYTTVNFIIALVGIYPTT